jgi:membrane associated rhomboid family serine protease
MWPRLGASKFVTRWIVVTLVASIIAALDGGWLASVTALAPSQIFRGQVWRLVTWPLIASGPMSLVLTCAAIYKFGGELAVRWGDRRLRRFAGQIVVGAAVVTCVLAAVAGQTYLQRLGGWALIDALVIAWARQFPEAPLVVYDVLVLRGRQLIGVTVGVAIIFAIYAGPITMAPELVACAAAAAYPRFLLRR